MVELLMQSHGMRAATGRHAPHRQWPTPPPNEPNRPHSSVRYVTPRTVIISNPHTPITIKYGHETSLVTRLESPSRLILAPLTLRNCKTCDAPARETAASRGQRGAQCLLGAGCTTRAKAYQSTTYLWVNARQSCISLSCFCCTSLVRRLGTSVN